MLRELLTGLSLGRRQRLPNTRVFYLGADDSLASVIDRLDWVDSERVILAIPVESPVLSGRLELMRVKRHALRKRIDVSVVTLEASQRDTMRELGIPVFSSVERAQNSQWRLRDSSPSVVETPAHGENRPSPARLRPRESTLAGFILAGITAGVIVVLVYDLLTVSEIDLGQMANDAVYGVVGGAALGLLVFVLAWLFKRYYPRPYRWVRWVFMTAVFAAGLLAPIAAAFIILPEARLTVVPAQALVSAIARITVVVADPDQENSLEEIDFAGQRISGRRVSAEVGAEAVSAATGTSDVPTSRASGTVVFTNLLAQDYTVGQATAVRTSAGSPVRFLTTGDVTVPPLGQAAVGVEAVEPGPQGNVGTGLINRVEGASARAVRVTNPEPTRGGGLSQVRAVTQADREALQRTLLSELRAQGYQRVLERPASEGGLREGEYLVPGSVRVLEVLHETFDRFASEEAESVKLEMLVEVTGVVVDLGDAYNLARHVLTKHVPEGFQLKQAEYRPGLMGDNVIGEGTLTFFVEADGLAEAVLEPDQLKRWLRGRPYEEGIAMLDSAWRSSELPVKNPPDVQIQPTWADDRFPWLVWRIRVDESVGE